MESKIFAVDFDGTLCEDQWPLIGEPKLWLIDLLLELQDMGHKLILWTCREGELLEQAVKWCEHHGLEFDAINDNLKESQLKYGNNCRKIGADYFIDDKNIELDNFSWFVTEMKLNKRCMQQLNEIKAKALTTIGEERVKYWEKILLGRDIQEEIQAWKTLCKLGSIGDTSHIENYEQLYQIGFAMTLRGGQGRNYEF